MIDVIWYNARKGENWDHGLLLSIFDKHPQLFNQWDAHVRLMNRSIVIVSGTPSIEQLRDYLCQLEEGIVILCSDERSELDYKAAIPRHLQIWTQYFSEDRRELENRLLMGPPQRIKNFKINRHLKKKYLWSFVGQINNEHRERCLAVMKKLKGGFLQVTTGFGGMAEDGMAYQDYLDILCQSHYVICPTGTNTAETFRFYEAMECGAIPITERRSPRDPETFNYWTEMGLSREILWLSEWESIQDAKIKPDILTTENLWYSLYKSTLEKALLKLAYND